MVEYDLKNIVFAVFTESFSVFRRNYDDSFGFVI
jgi:hypothetical protein